MIIKSHRWSRKWIDNEDATKLICKRLFVYFVAINTYFTMMQLQHNLLKLNVS